MNGRAELKVEGGKLLRADVSFEEEIEDVELHGDFFVYPEAALGDIEEAVEGVDVDTGSGQLAGLVEEAVGPNVRMVGFGPENVAEVVKEAVHGAE